jgi:Tfp pilus assembly protein PilN
MRGLKARGWDREELRNIIVCGEADEGRGVCIEEMEEWVEKMVVPAAFLPNGPGGERLPADARSSFGLALRGFDKEMPPVNLLSSVKSIQKKKIRPTTVIPVVAVALLIVIVYLFVPFLLSRGELRRINEEFAILQPAKVEVEKLQEDLQEIEKRMEQLESISGGGAQGLHLLKELTEILPHETWLSEFRYRGGKVEIAGYSSSASTLIVLIENSPLFTEVTFSAPVTVVEKNVALGTTRGRQRIPFVRGGGPESTPVQGDKLERFKIKALLVVNS